jgi:nicotinamidase/pyrazinamidase
MIKLNKDDFLLVVDPQNDFVTGSLAVAGAPNIMPLIRKYVDKFFAIKQLGNVVISMDIHPVVHYSFKENGGVWPAHCVIGTWGSSLSSELADTNLLASVIRILKGTNISEEAYSPFRNTGLGDYLRKIGAKRLFICGLATDYCVKAAVEDATIGRFFDGETFVLTDAIAAVNIKPADGVRAIQEMVKNGAKLRTWEDFDA